MLRNSSWINLSAAAESAKDVRDFPVKAGDVILREQPWIYSLFPENMTKYCYRCFVPFDPELEELRNERHVDGCGIAGIACSGCGVPRYCSTQCQNNDKNSPFRHGHECKLLKTFRANAVQPTNDLLILLKLMLRRKVEKSGDVAWEGSVCQPATDRTYARLMAHTEDILADEARLQHVQQLRTLLGHLLWEADVPDLQSMVQMFGKIKVNSYDIRDPFGRRLGEGVYLGASQFDHSCQRNAVFYFEGPNIVIKALTDIASINDVRISYTEIFSTTALRQQYLQEYFYFQCTCQLCTDPQKEAELECILCCTPSCKRALPLDQRADDTVCADCLSFVQNNCPRSDGKVPATETNGHVEAEEVDWSDFDYHKDINHRLRLARRLLPLDHKQHSKINKMMQEKEATKEVLEEIEQRCLRMLDTAQLLLHPLNVTRCLTHDLLAKVMVLMGTNKTKDAVLHFDLSLPGLRRCVDEKDPRLGLQLVMSGLLHLQLSNHQTATDRCREAMDIFAVCEGRKRPLYVLSAKLFRLATDHDSSLSTVAPPLKVLSQVLCHSLFPTTES